MTDDTDPAVHWLTRRRYGRDDAGEPVSRPRPIADEIADTRAQLAAEVPAPPTDPDEPPIVTRLRALAIASVLEECAERLRRAADAGDPLGSTAVADLAADLATQLYRRTILDG
jgi:hypothetical protein